MPRVYFTSLSVIVLFIITSCASTRTVKPAPDLNSACPPDKVRFVVGRESGFAGSARTIDILDQSGLIGNLGPGGWLAWERAPGSTTISATITDITFIEYRADYQLTATGGETHAFLLTMKPDGLSGRIDLMHVPADNAQYWKNNWRTPKLIETSPKPSTFPKGSESQ